MVGLIARIRHRVGYVWRWRLRHWWYDTRSGAQARVAGICLLAVVFVVELIRNAVAALAPAPQRPHEAVIMIIVWLIIALIVGIAVALSMHSSAQAPPDQKATGPTTQDGKSAPRLYGTYCIQNPAELGWKVTGKDPVQSDGGKK